MKFCSSKDFSYTIDSLDAIFNPLINSEGFAIPQKLPSLTTKDFSLLSNMTFAKRISYVLSLFFDFNSEFENICTKIFSIYDDGDPYQLVQINEDEFFVELYSGNSLTINDITAQILAAIINFTSKNNLKLVFKSEVIAHSVIEAFKNIPNKIYYICNNENKDSVTKLILKINYPNFTYIVDNTDVEIEHFVNNLKFENGYLTDSSFNFLSIYVKLTLFISTYCDFLDSEIIDSNEKLNYAIPLNDFTDLISAFYAKDLGVPINKIICAQDNGSRFKSFFKNGETTLVNNNESITPCFNLECDCYFEQLILELTNRNIKNTQEILQLAKNNSVAQQMLFLGKSIFSSSSTNEDIVDFIYDYFDEYGYLMDPHTAAIVCAAADYSNETNENVPTLYFSPYSPYLFPQSVYFAISEKNIDKINIVTNKLFEESGMEIPLIITGINKNHILNNKKYTLNEITTLLENT